MLFQITAHIYNTEGKITQGEKTYSFFRAYSATKPTFTGAARMVAKAIEVKPSDVCVTRIEAMVYQTR